MWLENIKTWLQQYPWIYNNLKFVGVLALAFLSYYLTKKIILRYVKYLVNKTKTKYDDIFLNEVLLRRISFLVPLIIFHEFAYLIPEIQSLLYRLTESLVIFIILLIISSVSDSFLKLLQTIEKFKNRPIKSYIQVIKIVIYIFGSIVIIGVLTGQQPWALLGGLGALTAVILLVFRDTILSFVASIQITSYDLVKIGDWIEVSKFGADGDVIDISLNIVKIQNFDKTITVIPTYKLLDETFKNWRGMQQTGGRRIKRSVNIDLSSVKFCTDEMILKFKKMPIIKEYLENKLTELKKYNDEKGIDPLNMTEGRRITNIGTFRAYLKEYLKQREDIHKGLTFLVRQLPAGPQGIPIEIYVFVTTTAWVKYEEIQADIFDHIFAVVPEFGLKIFQNPTGFDFRSLSKTG